MVMSFVERVGWGADWRPIGSVGRRRGARRRAVEQSRLVPPAP